MKKVPVIVATVLLTAVIVVLAVHSKNEEEVVGTVDVP